MVGVVRPSTSGSLPGMFPGSVMTWAPILTSADVAELFGRPVKTIQALVRKGRIPAHRLPGARRYWFLREEIVAWLHSDETKVGPW